MSTPASWSLSWAHSLSMISSRAPRLRLPGAPPWSVSVDASDGLLNKILAELLTFDLSHLSVDHVSPQPGDSLLEAFEHWQEAADKKACCDYSLHVDIPQWNESVKDELELLVQEKGTSSYSSVLQSCGQYCSSSCSSLLWTHFTRTIGTELGTIWPGVESSYSEVTVEIHCPHHGAVMVAVCKLTLVICFK